MLQAKPGRSGKQEQERNSPNLGARLLAEQPCITLTCHDAPDGVAVDDCQEVQVLGPHTAVPGVDIDDFNIMMTQVVMHIEYEIS